MKQEPLVSILMNCYNGKRYLREAIDSVLAQTYQNWELVFWDNQSTDESAEIFKSYNDSRLKYFYAPAHADLGGGRAAAWGHLAGDFIAVLDVDDVWLPQKLEKQLPLFDDPDVGIVTCDVLFFNDRKERACFAGNFPPTGWVFDKLLGDYYISLVSVVIRKSAALRLLVHFDPNYSSIADFDLIVRMSLISKLDLYPEVLAKWRVHAESETWKNFHLFVEEKERWIGKYISENLVASEKYSLPIRQFKSRNKKNKAFIELLCGRRGRALKVLLGGRFDCLESWILMFLCLLPFSSAIAYYLYGLKINCLPCKLRFRRELVK